MVIMEDGLRPLGKPMDSPPYPTIMRAPHFYPDCAREAFAPNGAASSRYLFQRLDQAQIGLELLRLADLDPPEIGMKRIEQVIELGRDDSTRRGKNGGV